MYIHICVHIYMCMYIYTYLTYIYMFRLYLYLVDCFPYGSEVAQSCLTLFDSMDCSLPGSSLHGILQARILEWLPFPSPGDLPDPGIEPRSPTLQADALTSEPSGKPRLLKILSIVPCAVK